MGERELWRHSFLFSFSLYFVRISLISVSLGADPGQNKEKRKKKPFFSSYSFSLHAGWRSLS
jgi:hypothetical protein